MSAAIGVLGLLLTVQVPAPSSDSDTSKALTARRVEIEAREARELSELAVRLEAGGDAGPAGEVRRLIRVPEPPDGITRFRPLPDHVPGGPKSAPGLSSIPATAKKAPEAPANLKGWASEAAAVRSKAAEEFFRLAEDAASEVPPRLAMADTLLRLVLERNPDHAEARRLLGYVRYEDGWARPFVVRQFREGMTDHAVFGWVPKEWVSHLEQGELPAPSANARSQRARWLPAMKANAQRADWSPPWTINTEHFQIQTNVPLAEAIRFGRRLEAFHDLFFAMMADVIGESHPLARRFKDPGLTADADERPHLVFYFANKDQYVKHLRPLTRTDVEQSLGYYDPEMLARSRGDRVPAYFFRDEGGQLPVEATLYHEVSHQLLFESTFQNAYKAYKKNVGNYWVFEGLGTYFETVVPQPDGTLEVGGLVGPRIEKAIEELVDSNQGVPLERFVRLGQSEFNQRSRIYLHYQEAMALTIFLMQARGEAYRADFLDYVRDALRGRLKGGSGRSLDDRVGTAYTELGRELVEFLKQGRPSEPSIELTSPDQGRGTPAAAKKPAGIRTVP